MLSARIARAARGPRRGRHRAAGRRRAGRGPRPRHRPSRHQERQHHRQRAGPGEGARLRPCEVLAGARGPGVGGHRADRHARHDGGTVLGTVSYMAPEQALGRPADQRSDLFSLGVVLYEMLAGRLPFQGQSFSEIVDAILHQAPPALARFNYAVTPEIDAVVRRALEKSPDMRYQDARSSTWTCTRLRSMLDDTERHGSARAPRSSGSLRRGGRRRKTPSRSSRSPTSRASRPTNGSDRASPRR